MSSTLFGPSSRRGSDSDDQPLLSRISTDRPTRFERTRELKEKHAEKRIERTGETEEIPRLHSPTICTLVKRKSFREKLYRRERKTKSVDYTEGAYLFERSIGDDEEGSVNEIPQRPRTVLSRTVPFDLSDLQKFVEDDDSEQDSVSDIEKLRQDVERAYHGVFPGEQFRETQIPSPTNHETKICRPLTPLSTDGISSVEDDLGIDGFGPSEGKAFLAMPFHESNRECDATRSHSMPTTWQLLNQKMDICPNPFSFGKDATRSNDLEGHPFRVDASSSFNTTGGMFNSPKYRRSSISSCVDASRFSIQGNDFKRLDKSIDDSPIPRQPHGVTLKPFSDVYTKAAVTALEVDHQLDTVMRESPETAFVQSASVHSDVTDHATQDKKEKPRVVRSLLRASVFAGLATIIGTIFLERS